MSTATSTTNEQVDERLAMRAIDEHATTGSLLIIGGGGYGAVVAESARSAGWQVIGYLDDSDDSVTAASRINLERLGATADVIEAFRLAYGTLCLHAATGDAALRENWLEHGLATAIEADLNIHAPAIVHPSALVSPSASIGGAAYIGAGAVINARAELGRGAIINTGVIVEHDSRIGAYAHVAPGAVLTGAVEIGRGAMVGAGATVLPGVRVGDGATIGAGAVVISDIAAGTIAAGSPARLQEA